MKCAAGAVFLHLILWEGEHWYIKKKPPFLLHTGMWYWLYSGQGIIYWCKILHQAKKKLWTTNLVPAVSILVPICLMNGTSLNNVIIM